MHPRSPNSVRIVRGILDGGAPVRVGGFIGVPRAVDPPPSGLGSGRRVAFAPEGDTTGVWDRDRVAQMLARLVNNARRHGDAAAVEVCVRGAHDHVEVIVENRGSIDDAAMAHLFQPLVPASARGARSSS